MLKDIKTVKIPDYENLNNAFFTASLNNIDQKCIILNGAFYADSFSYFPITHNDESFTELFKRQSDNSIQHFYSEQFYKDFTIKRKDFKIFKESYLLGSNPGDNYYSNLIEFLPRIFFTDEPNLNLLVHRNLSSKFRKLITDICSYRNIKVKLSYLDDDFYKFENSQIPQFININNSIKILKFFLDQMTAKVSEEKNNNLKIYVRREDSFYRKPLNEADIIQKLKARGYMILNPQQYDIVDQIALFAEAKEIIAAHGSSLANIIFCKKGTTIYEIRPQFDKDYEVNLSNRYKNISNLLELNYSTIDAESVNVEKHSKLAEKYISKKILTESNYYKNIIIKLNKLDNL